LRSILTRPSWPHSAARCRAVRRCYKQHQQQHHHQRQQQ